MTEGDTISYIARYKDGENAYYKRIVDGNWFYEFRKGILDYDIDNLEQSRIVLTEKYKEYRGTIAWAVRESCTRIILLEKTIKEADNY